MKMSNTLTLFAICVMVTFNLAFAGPGLTIPDPTFDFGYVPQNSTISHVFWLHSTGDDSLKIIKVSPG
jgi:hypothetical protein